MTAPGRGSLLVPALLAAGLFPLLAALRHLDDNSLASWAWTLEGRDAVGVWVLHLAAVAVAALLAGRPLPARARLPALAAAGFLAGIAAALAGEPEAVIDASRYFAQAKFLELHGFAAFLAGWGGEVGAWTDLPLPALAFGALFRVFGESRAAAQALTAGLLALTVVATARVGALLGDEDAGLLGGLLLLAAPVLLVNTPLLMADLMTACAVAVALWTLLAASARGGASRVAAGGAAVGAALLAKYSAWPLLAALVGGLLLREALRRRPAGAARVAAAAALGGLLLLAFAAPQRGVVEGQLRLLGSYQWAGLRRWVESYPSTFLFHVHPLLAGGALAAGWRGVRRRDPDLLALAAVPLVLLALGVRRSRYLLPALPMLALLAARALGALDARARRFAALAAVGFSLVTVFALQVPFLRWVNTANLAAAGRLLDASGVAEARVWVTPSPEVAMNPEVAIPLLDYHTGARVLAAGPPPVRPAEGVLATSSLRFTWDAPLPAWYREPLRAGGRAAAVLVAGDPGAAPPAGLVEEAGVRPPDAVFLRDAVFRYRALVSVWLPR